MVNHWLETSAPNVYAAGGCALQFHRLKNSFEYSPLGTTANKQGRIAGMNMAGEKRRFLGFIGTSILKFIYLTLGKTGLYAREVEELNIPYDIVNAEVSHISSYYPGANTIHIKIIYHRDTQHLLGAQIIGENGVDKRIDVLSVALFNQMKLGEMEDLDLAYAPPYNGVWDPAQRAVRKALR